MPIRTIRQPSMSVFEDLNLDIAAGKLRRRVGTQRLRQIDAGKAPERHFAARGRQRDGLRAGHEAGRKFACHPPARWAWCSRTQITRLSRTSSRKTWPLRRKISALPRRKSAAVWTRLWRQLECYEYRKHAPHLLSGGQKQRVAIAGVLAMQPKIHCAGRADRDAGPRRDGRRSVHDCRPARAASRASRSFSSRTTWTRRSVPTG